MVDIATANGAAKQISLCLSFKDQIASCVHIRPTVEQVSPALIGGMVDGALQLDGVDDHVSTPFVLNPADGKFDIYAWIKGGAPGQTIISQADGVDWLSADPSEGNLMTELKGTSRNAAELLSQTVTTDGQWHRIGFVWDDSYRTLYVDDMEVTRDMDIWGSLEDSDGGLHIGAGKNLEPGSFFSGLIDDVRIYNRAVIP